MHHKAKRRNAYYISRLLCCLPDLANIPYKEMTDKQKYVRLLNECYKLLMGEAFDKNYFQELYKEYGKESPTLDF